MMRSAIVTGASGFIGRWLVRELLRENIPVTAIVQPASHNKRFLPENKQICVIECAMNDYDTLPEKLSKKKDCVFYHLAWAGVVGVGRTDLKLQFDNVRASENAVKVASLMGCSAFIGIGSIMEAEAAIAAETDGCSPGLSYIYGEAKHFSHLVTKATAAEKGIVHLWPVLTNVYGEYEYSSRFINLTLRKMINHERLQFTEGMQLYDFIHIEDAVKALIAVGKSGKAFHQYLIGSGNAIPLREYIEMIGRLVAPRQRLYFGEVPFTGISLPVENFSISTLIRDTGFIPSISFETGICRTYEWIKKSNILKEI